MKKVLLVLSMMTVLWSCKKAGQNDSELSETTTSNGKLPISKVKADPVWHVLGYGYDATLEYARSSAAKAPVINVNALKNAISTAVQDNPDDFATSELNEGMNVVEWSKSKKVSLGIDTNKTGNSLFKGTIRAAFNDSTTESSKYVYATYNDLVIKKRLYISATKETMRQYLTSQFLSDLETQSPAEIVNTYGTHVMTDIFLGGTLEATYRSETSSANKSTAAKAGINIAIKNIFNLNTELTTYTSEANFNYSQQLSYTTVGGNSSSEVKRATVQVGPNHSYTTIDLSTWRTSVTEQNAALVKFNADNSIILLYEFVSDPTKREALKQCIEKYILDRELKLKADIRSIHRYWNPSGSDHYYTDWYQPGGISGGWGYESIEFKALGAANTGSSPVHSYWNSSRGDHYYERGTARSIYGYAYEGVVFHAYSTQIPGTVPVYQYYDRNGVDHFYTTVNGSYPGYVYETVAFYAYPAN